MTCVVIGIVLNRSNADILVPCETRCWWSVSTFFQLILCIKAIIIRVLSDLNLKRKPKSKAIKQSRSENDISLFRLTDLCHVWKLRARGAWTRLDKSGPCWRRCWRGRKSKSFITIYSVAVNLISSILLHRPSNAISIWLFWHKWHTTCCFVNLLDYIPAE